MTIAAAILDDCRNTLARLRHGPVLARTVKAPALRILEARRVGSTARLGTHIEMAPRGQGYCADPASFEIDADDIVEAVRGDLVLKNGLRWLAGVSGVFMPEQPTIDQLVLLGLAVEHDRSAWRTQDRYRPSDLATGEVLLRIGARG